MREPIFILRAGDPLAADLIDWWAEMYDERLNAIPGLSEDARRHAAEMREWQQSNGTVEANEIRDARAYVEAPRAGVGFVEITPPL